MNTWMMLMTFVVSCATPTKQEEEKSVRDDLRQEINDEISIGREMAAKLLGHMGSYKENDKALEYINMVGTSLAQKIGRAELSYRFAILSSKEINAFATPGGYIFLTSGLIAAIQDESELAAILGHEIAHINEKHMYHEIAPKRDVSASETITRVMSRGNSDLGKSITQLVNKGLKMLLEEGMGLEKERAADSASIVYVDSLGYNPHALVRFLKRIAAYKDSRIPKTAPEFAARISTVEKALRENGLEDRSTADLKVLNQRFIQYLGRSSPSAGT